MVINSGALNPSGLAQKIVAAAAEKHMDLKIAYVSGNNVLSKINRYLDPLSGLKHLDGENANI